MSRSLPLLFQPGERWEYSMSPAVLVRLVEIITGQRYLEALQQRLFSPPGHANCSSLARI
jgi:CubicO group peptidase (beta-lactamase class C family)